MKYLLKSAGTFAAVLLVTGLVAARTLDIQTQARKATSAEVEVVTESIAVLQELTATPDKGIPKHLLGRAEAIVVIPTLIRGGFVIGAKHGKGLVSVRERSSSMTTSQWSAPAIIKLTGGSIGWQIGLEKVDLVMLVMNRKGVDDLLADKFTIGGSASLTAGPVGRSADASTDAQMSSKILAYSRSQGLFASISLEGAGLHADDDDNEDLYGQGVRLRDVLNGKVSTQPAVVETWRSAIARITK